MRYIKNKGILFLGSLMFGVYATSILSKASPTPVETKTMEEIMVTEEEKQGSVTESERDETVYVERISSEVKISDEEEALSEEKDALQKGEEVFIWVETYPTTDGEDKTQNLFLYYLEDGTPLTRYIDENLGYGYIALEDGEGNHYTGSLPAIDMEKGYGSFFLIFQ